MGAPLNRTARSGGFSLIEALVAIVIVGLMSTVVARSIVDSRRAVSNDEARNQANYKAARIIDSLRAMGVSGMEDGDTTWACKTAGDHVEFTCDRTISALSKAVSGRVSSRKVAVDVKWEIMKAPHSVHVEGVVE